jgi:hypothetical protein
MQSTAMQSGRQPHQYGRLRGSHRPRGFRIQGGIRAHGYVPRLALTLRAGEREAGFIDW